MLLTLDGILSAEELDTLRHLLSTGEFESGVRTAKGSAAKVKDNLQLTEEDPGIEEARQLIQRAMKRNAIFRALAYPSRFWPPRFSRYTAGMRYGTHIDSPFVGENPPVRLDVSITVFISGPDEYEGGELVIDTDYGIRQFKLSAGSCVVYPASTFHRVEEVTAGERLVSFFWVQSMVADTARRKILFDLADSIEYLDRFGEPGRHVETLRRCHANLLRMWSRP